MGRPAPSPSPSVQTARSAPNPRPSANMLGFSQSNPLHRDNRIDPNLSGSLAFLQVPPGSRPRTSLASADPIARFYEGDAPWSAERPRNQSMSFSHSSFSQPNMNFSRYPDNPGSEIESIPQRSDSGYGTMPRIPLAGAASDHIEHEIPSEVDFAMRNINVSSAVSEPEFRVTTSVTDQASQYSRGSRSQGGKEIRCRECNEVSKCKSDHKCV